MATQLCRLRWRPTASNHHHRSHGTCLAREPSEVREHQESRGRRRSDGAARGMLRVRNRDSSFARHEHAGRCDCAQRDGPLPVKDRPAGHRHGRVPHDGLPSASSSAQPGWPPQGNVSRCGVRRLGRLVTGNCGRLVRDQGRNTGVRSHCRHSIKLGKFEVLKIRITTDNHQAAIAFECKGCIRTG